MREIKFRGYAVEELIGSQWICDGYGASKVDYTDGTSSYHLLTPYGNYHVEEDSIGQYTGFKDVTGKEIFEGDILESQSIKHIDDNNTIEKPLLYVKWDDGQYALFDEDSWQDSLYGHISCFDVKVVGNIYEYSDLLKEKSNNTI